MFMVPRNWFQGMNSASPCSLAGRYDNPIPSRYLAPIDFFKFPAQGSVLKPVEHIAVKKSSTWAVTEEYYNDKKEKQIFLISWFQHCPNWQRQDATYNSPLLLCLLSRLKVVYCLCWLQEYAWHFEYKRHIRMIGSFEMIHSTLPRLHVYIVFTQVQKI
jgi:hypothetical protein